MDYPSSMKAFICFINNFSGAFSKSTDADFVNIVEGLGNVYVQVAS